MEGPSIATSVFSSDLYAAQEAKELSCQLYELHFDVRCDFRIIWRSGLPPAGEVQVKIALWTIPRVCSIRLILKKKKVKES